MVKSLAPVWILGRFVRGSGLVVQNVLGGSLSVAGATAVPLRHLSGMMQDLRASLPGRFWGGRKGNSQFGDSLVSLRTCSGQADGVDNFSASELRNLSSSLYVEAAVYLQSDFLPRGFCVLVSNSGTGVPGAVLLWGSTGTLPQSSIASKRGSLSLRLVYVCSLCKRLLLTC